MDSHTHFIKPSGMAATLCWWSEKEFNAILEVFGNSQDSAPGEHTSCCSHRNDVLCSGIISSVDECTDWMCQWLEQCATYPDHLHDTTAIIWQDYVTHFTEQLGQTFVAWINTKTKFVYHARERTVEGKTISKVEIKYRRTNQYAFLRYSSTSSDDDWIQLMMCFAPPQPLNILLYHMVSLQISIVISYSLFTQYLDDISF